MDQILNGFQKLYNSKQAKKIKRYLKRIWEVIRKNEMRILPGNIAFFLVLSIAPIITLIGILGAQFTNSYAEVMNFVNDSMPQGVIDLLNPFLQNAATSPKNVIIYLIIGFFIASNAADSIIIASNTLYKTDNNNYLFRRFKALIITLILIILFLFIIFLLAFSNIIYTNLIKVELITPSKTIYNLFSLFKWPIAYLIIIYVVSIIYSLSVHKKVRIKHTIKGAFITATGWIFVTAIYSYYANNIARYDIFYGGLANIVILMIWIYILSYILVVGMAINSSIYENLVKNGKIIEKK